MDLFCFRWIPNIDFKKAFLYEEKSFLIPNLLLKNRSSWIKLISSNRKAFNSPAGPYFCLHSEFVQIGNVTSCKTDGCGPFSLKLPQPTTVPVSPLNCRDPAAGRQIGLIVFEKGTFLSRVRMAMSLYSVRESNPRWRTTRFIFRSTCATSVLTRILCSPSRAVNRATSHELMLKIFWNQFSCRIKSKFISLSNAMGRRQNLKEWKSFKNLSQWLLTRVCITWMSSMREPPQNCRPPLNSTAIQGHSFGSAFWPPTIRFWS